MAFYYTQDDINYRLQTMSCCLADKASTISNKIINGGVCKEDLLKLELYIAYIDFLRFYSPIESMPDNETIVFENMNSADTYTASLEPFDCSLTNTFYSGEVTGAVFTFPTSGTNTYIHVEHPSNTAFTVQYAIPVTSGSTYTFRFNLIDKNGTLGFDVRNCATGAILYNGGALSTGDQTHTLLIPSGVTNIRLKWTVFTGGVSPNFMELDNLLINKKVSRENCLLESDLDAMFEAIADFCEICLPAKNYNFDLCDA